MSSTRRSTKIVRALVALALVAALVAVLALSPRTEHPSEALGFIGRFHILALHAPIGVLVATLLAEAGTFLRRHRRGADLIVTFTLPLLVLTGAAAILLGLLLAQSGDYPLKLVERHRNLTLLGVLVAGIATLLLPYRRRAGRWGHRALLALAAGLVGLGAHFGGSITHGSDFLFPTKSAPPVSSAEPDAGALIAPEPADAAPPSEDASALVAVIDAAAPPVRDASAPAPAKVLTSKQITESMLQRKCGPCHTKLSKGGLRVTDLGNLKAGEVVPGDPASSKLYARMVLPLDHDDHMPPSDKVQPTAGEIGAVRKWITDLGK